VSAKTAEEKVTENGVRDGLRQVFAMTVVNQDQLDGNATAQTA